MSVVGVTTAKGVNIVSITPQSNSGNSPGVVITLTPTVGNWVICVIASSNRLFKSPGWKFRTNPDQSSQFLAIVSRRWTSQDAATQVIAGTSNGLISNSIICYELAGANLGDPIDTIAFGVTNSIPIVTLGNVPSQPGILPIVAFASLANASSPSSIVSPFSYDATQSNNYFGLSSYIATAHSARSGNTAIQDSGSFTPGSGVTGPYYTATIFIKSSMPGNISNITNSESQTRLAILQVFRGGNWITIPFESMKGTVGKGKAGSLEIAIPEIKTDPKRAQLFEGEKVRMFRGVIGAPMVRSFTGYVDSREPTDSIAGISRKVVCTDVIKELNDAILLNGLIYDNLTPTQAAVDLLNRTIASGQYVPTDDLGNLLTDTTNATNPNGNLICYFPDLYNDDGSLFFLPSGTIASFTNPNNKNPHFDIPIASAGYNYVTFAFPQNHLIASTTNIFGFTQVSTSQSFPPSPGTYILDAYNGFAYFNVADGSRTASFTASYYSSPLFGFDPGAKVGDVLAQLFDQAGNKYKVDGTGKIISQFVDLVTAPKRILNKGSYITSGVEINRDRRNVIICEGWDGNCGGLLISKCILTDDINNPPPYGLGKRAYVVIRDQAWKTQYAVNNASYYAALQIGKRGKIVSISMMDDPTIMVDDVLAFESTFPEISSQDYFVTEQVQYDLSVGNGSVKSSQNVSGTLLSARGTIYLGPASATAVNGALDYSKDIRPIFSCSLQDHISHNQIGGSYFSTFSIVRGLDLVYQVGVFPIKESIDVYGSDGSHIVMENNIPVFGNQVRSLPLPIAGNPAARIPALIPGVLYVFKFYARDTNGNIGIFRDSAMAVA